MAVESATDHQEGTVHTVPSPKHTHNPERASALRAAGGALCSLGEERSPLPSQHSPERVPGQRPGAGQLGPRGRVIRSQRESPARALQDGLSTGEPRSPLGAGCVAPYTLHCPPRAFHSPPPGGSGGSLRHALHTRTKTPPPQPPAGQLGPPSGTPPRAGPGPAPGPICPLQGPSPHQVSGEGAQGPPGHPIQRGWRTLSCRHLGSFTSSSAFVHRKVAWKAASRTHHPWHSPPRPARLTGSQGGGGLNPCTWAAASLLRQVSEAAPGISRSRKRGWRGGAWTLGPRDAGRKEEPCPAASCHCEAQRGPDKTRAGLSSGAPTQRGRLPSACSGLRAGGRARLRIGL